MPEGDSLRRAALELQALVGMKVEVETPHPRAAVKHIAERIDGLTLEEVVPNGKNLLLRFEGGLVLRSHLRMTGRWRVEPAGTRRTGLPWLVLRAGGKEAVLWNGPVLELGRGNAGTSRLGPDILDDPPDIERMIERLRSVLPTRDLGDALLDQSLVAGIGNIWKAESLWETRLSPWSPIVEVGDEDLAATLAAAHRLMAGSVEGVRPLRRVYRRAGRPCSRCGAAIRSQPQGPDARTAYWCPGCQRGGREPES